MNTKTEQIKSFLLHTIDRKEDNIVRSASEYFNISRQAIHKHLQQLIEDGLVATSGTTRNKEYELIKLVEQVWPIELTSRTEEDMVWRKSVRPLLEGISSNVMNICQYGFTEMLNNSIDHSEGTEALISIEYNAVSIKLVIGDNGIGIFNKIKNVLGLEDERHALFELTKGKVTTDPSRHSGQGIFFTSRVFDRFSILSGSLYFTHDPDDTDWLLQNANIKIAGTQVSMTIDPFSNRTIKEVFDRYSSDEDYGFNKTHISVSLMRYGDENLVSRSQAKRLLVGIDKFQDVILDFAGMNTIGQAFADEIFRVFKSQHPNINIYCVNTNQEINEMITRATRKSIDDLSPYTQLSIFDM